MNIKLVTLFILIFLCLVAQNWLTKFSKSLVKADTTSSSAISAFILTNIILVYYYLITYNSNIEKKEEFRLDFPKPLICKGSGYSLNP